METREHRTYSVLEAMETIEVIGGGEWIGSIIVDDDSKLLTAAAFTVFDQAR